MHSKLVWNSFRMNNLLPGTWYLVHTWYLEPGNYLGLGTLHLVTGTWYLAPGNWYLNRFTGNLVPVLAQNGYQHQYPVPSAQYP